MNKTNETGVNWRKIKAEYIAGGISQRELAEKHGISQRTIERRAQQEKWTEKRKDADGKAVEKVAEKTAETVADNAVVLERIKSKILAKVEKMIDAYDTDATEYSTVKKTTKGKKAAILKYKIKDLAAVYESLSDKVDKPGQGADVEDLAPLAELLKDE